jgi:hypothetical protein
MSWKPDLDWSISVFEAVVAPDRTDPQNVALRDELNVRMATQYALEALRAVRRDQEASKIYGVRPTVTTLCGSSRFPDLHMQVMMALTLQGRVVIPMGCYGHADYPTGARFLISDGDEATPEKQALDQLHFRKIEMSDGIFVVNPGDYVGSSTLREVAHAKKLGKTVEWLFPTRHET